MWQKKNNESILKTCVFFAETNCSANEKQCGLPNGLILNWEQHTEQKVLVIFLFCFYFISWLISRGTTG